MKRNINIEEATNILEQLTGIKPEVKYCPGTDRSQLLIVWDDPRFAKLRLHCPTSWTLDQHHNPHPPIYGIQSADIIRHINLPEVREDAYILAGHQIEGQYYPSWFDSSADTLNHFLIIQQDQIYDPNYKHHTTGWQKLYLPSMSELAKQRINNRQTAYEYISATHHGHYWRLYILPIGFRFFNTAEERKPVLDTRQQVTDYIQESRDTLIDLYAAALQEQSQYFEDIYQETLDKDAQQLHRLQHLCDEFNARLTYIRDNCSAYASLGSFSVKNNQLLFGSRLYSIDQAAKTIKRLERQRDQYEKFLPVFESRRQKIDNLYGEIDVTNPNYVEVTLPKSAFGPQESSYETKRFSYTQNGYAALDTWLSSFGG